MIKPFQPEESPDEIASHIPELRDRVDRNLERLNRELSPVRLLDRARDQYAPDWAESAKSAAATVRQAIRRHPVTTALLCCGLVAWLVESGRSRKARRPDPGDYDPSI